MSELTIYIPTYRRVHKQISWQYLSPYWRERAFLVAVPEEADQLREAGYPVLTDYSEPGISATRQWVIDNHPRQELGDRIMMMDDDLRFFKRREDDPEKFLNLSTPGDEEFDEMMDKVLGLMGVASLVGIANRSGANRHTQPVIWNSRMHDLYAMDLDVVHRNGFRIDRVPYMEDFDFILQHLTAGHLAAMVNSNCKGDDGSGAKGGCSEHRTAEGQAASAVDLALMWPDFVKTERKKAKGQGMWGERIDVRVQWKKAAEAGSKA